MTINVLNEVPLFTVPLVDQYLHVSKSVEYQIISSDPEGYTNTVTQIGIPLFGSLTGDKFTFVPTYSEVNGTSYPISVSIFDGAMF